MTHHDDSATASTQGSAANIREGIDHTRQEMGATLGALEQRLRPGVLGDKANAEIDHLEARVKSAIKEGIDEARVAVAASLKEGVHEAKEAVTHGLKEARETVKKDLDDAITHTKHNVREATLGRAELIATKAGDVMNDTRDTLVETIRQNPIPAALAGIGIAWLLMNRSSSNRRRGPDGYARRDAYNPYAGMAYGAEGGGQSHGGPGFVEGVGRALVGAEHAVADTAGAAVDRAGRAAKQVGGAIADAGSTVAGAARDVITQGADAVTSLTGRTGQAAGRMAHEASDAASHLVHDATEAAGQLAHRAHDMGASVAGSARNQASRVEDGMAAAWDSNPLAFGAVALAAGAALGYALPRTQPEDQLMGAVRDKAVHQFSATATEAVKSFEHLAEGAGKAAKDVVAKAAT